MKKRLVTYLLISAMAATVFAGCSKKGGDAANASATGEAAVTEAEVTEETEAGATDGAEEFEKVPIDEAVAAAEAAETAEAAEIAGTSDAAEAEIEDADEATAEEYIADDEAEEDATAVAAAEGEEDLIVDPGTQYTVRFGGNVYASPEQVDSNIIDYVYPGYVLTIDKRLDDFWYAITYWIDGYARTGYIKIQ